MGTNVTMLEPETNDADAGTGTRNQRLAEAVVGIDDRRFEVRKIEQTCLGSSIGIHVAVVVEVVAGQVGKDRDIEGHPGDARLVECVRGHLHADGLGAGLHETGQLAMYTDRIRRGVHGRIQFAGEPAPQRSDQSATMVSPVQRLGQQLRGRRLAVGAGHADHLEPVRGRTIETVGQMTDLLAQVAHADGDDSARVGFATLCLVKHCRGATRQRTGNELPAVGPCPREREKHVTGLDGATVERKTVNLRIPARRRYRNAGEQFTQAHGVSGSGFHVASPGTSDAVRRAGPFWLSGGISNRRSAPLMTRLNTGAATCPPK